MAKSEQEIRDLLHSSLKSKPITVLASVKSVDTAKRTCSIDDDGVVMYGVRLQPITHGTTGITIYPKVGAQVLCAKIEEGDDYMLLHASEVDKVEVAIGQSSITIESDKIELNGGNNDGLIKIADLTSKLNALVDWCANHTHSGVITAVSGGSGAPAVGTPGNTATPTSQPQKFDKSNYEDTAVTH